MHYPHDSRFDKRRDQIFAEYCAAIKPFDAGTRQGLQASFHARRRVSEAYTLRCQLHELSVGRRLAQIH